MSQFDSVIKKEFANRIVSVKGTLIKEGQPMSFCFTGMVMSFKDEWFYITAGHCIKDLNLYHQIFDVKSLQFVDSLGNNAVEHSPIPIHDYPELEKQYVYHVNGLDFGYIRITDYYKRLLISNKVEPISEFRWIDPPNEEKYFRYFLLGTPYGYLQPQPIKDNYLIPELYDVRKITNPPSILTDTFGHPPDEVWQGVDLTDSLFFGQLNQNIELPIVWKPDGPEESIVGMSGGPVLGFVQEGNEIKYWIVAMQSSWHPSTRTIKATPIRKFALPLWMWIDRQSGNQSVAEMAEDTDAM